MLENRGKASRLAEMMTVTITLHNSLRCKGPQPHSPEGSPGLGGLSEGSTPPLCTDGGLCTWAGACPCLCSLGWPRRDEPGVNSETHACGLHVRRSPRYLRHV